MILECFSFWQGGFGKEDSKRVIYVGKEGRFWRLKNNKCILGVHVTSALLCGFFEALGPLTEFSNSSLTVAFGNRARNPSRGLCWGKRGQKIILFPRIHTVFGLERVSPHLRACGRVCMFVVIMSYTRRSNSTRIVSCMSSLKPGETADENLGWTAGAQVSGRS